MSDQHDAVTREFGLAIIKAHSFFGKRSESAHFSAADIEALTDDEEVGVVAANTAAEVLIGITSFLYSELGSREQTRDILSLAVELALVTLNRMTPKDPT